MRKKIVGIFVCTLLIATLAIPISAINKEYEHNPISTGADVPVWEVGDSWTYLINMEVNNDKNKTSGYKYTNLEGKFEVVDDTGDYYTLEGTATYTPGTAQFYLGKLTFKNTRLTSGGMTLKLRKTDLGIYTYTEHGKGIMLLGIGNLTLPIPIQFEGLNQQECDPIWPLIPFPLFDGKNRSIPGTMYKFNGGYWKFFWGLIPIEFPTGSWSHSAIPYTVTEKQVTVEAGTFDAFEVFDGYDVYYFKPVYSAEVGNIIKYSHYIGHGDDILYHFIDMELKEYSYTP